MIRFLKKIYRSWLIEFLILFLILLAVIGYSSFEYLAIDITAYISTSAEWLLSLWFSLIDWYNNLLSGNYMKVLAGVAIGLAFLYLLFLRLRWRLRKSEKLTSADCPKCNYPLSRIKRTSMQHNLSKFIPLRRLYCKKCRWKGVRLKPADPTYITTGAHHGTQSKTQPIKSVD